MANPEGDFPYKDNIASIPGIELLPESELVLARLHAGHAFEAKYESDLHNFRADVVSLFSRQGFAHFQDLNWLIFELDDHEAEAGSVMLEPRKDLVVFAFTKLDEKGKPNLYVHMMINELYRISYDHDLTKYGHDYLVTDITVDDEGDAQYFIDAFPVREDLSHENAILPVFVLKDGAIQFPDDHLPERFTPMVNINNKDAERQVYPFGRYTNPEDRLHALSVAQKIIDQIKNLVPKASSLDKQDN